ncbi:hypothetical protein [Seonamhaeicola sp.]|uniref:CBU_0592 family membrane protein n=1 Tax=Seonamhaeicola sp. TaxID=1912245 RepID=UPI00260C39F3|nr:hypothetical protein [Seonamhaeicola sp.]
MSNFEIIGWLGSASYLISYFLLSINKLKSNSVTYQLMNVIGAICLIASAYSSKDRPNLFTNLVWMCIGITAIITILKKRK